MPDDASKPDLTITVTDELDPADAAVITDGLKVPLLRNSRLSGRNTPHREAFAEAASVGQATTNHPAPFIL